MQLCDDFGAFIGCGDFFFLLYFFGTLIPSVMKKMAEHDKQESVPWSAGDCEQRD